MNAFLKAAEIWQLDDNADALSLSASDYGDLEAFKQVSAEMRFAYGEGLPGKTWAEACPLIWTDFDHCDFKRTEAAKREGIVCGVSIPVCAGDFLSGVVVLFFGGGEAVSGALEVWGNAPGNQSELKLLDGYYGALERFEWVSRRLTMMRGRGLPGTAWESGQPVIIDNIGDSNTFLRARNAAESGITTGLAIPFPYHEADTRVLALLSSKGTPIARRFEIWLRAGGYLQFNSGHCNAGTDLQEQYQERRIAKGEGPLGRAWASGRPAILPAEKDGEGSTILLPLITACRVSALVVLGL